MDHRQAFRFRKLEYPGGVKTRNLLIWSAIALTAIVAAFAVQLFTDSRFLG
jgi:uncharacterized membrane protein YwzB